MITADFELARRAVLAGLEVTLVAGPEPPAQRFPRAPGRLALYLRAEGEPLQEAVRRALELHRELFSFERSGPQRP